MQRGSAKALFAEFGVLRESAHPPPASRSPNTSLIESPGHKLELVSVDDPDSLVARNDKAEVLAQVCARLASGDTTNARETLRSGYPFAPQAKVARRYTERQCLRVFYRDGFIDRYSGTRLVNPGVLRALSLIFPEDFPAHPNWQMAGTHFAFWELFPSIDHVVPVTRGGTDDETNWVSTSMLRNSAKAHWTLDELGWSIVAPGDHRRWDGLSGWFVEHAASHLKVATHNYVGRWLRATMAVRSEMTEGDLPPRTV
ncbi:HNH endonuclease [Gordonia polyisoprenivorans]|uniref:HNH endonuclease n=1 Tax=Gordonia polyisoprenivorans TaxID=84595 RepID=UPI001EE66970|nr:HNH endonuclease [Gordonia polyisoprenivorans]